MKIIIAMTQPFVLTVAGAVLVIGSAVIAGLYIKRLEGLLADAESQKASVDKKLAKARDAIEESYRIFDPANIRYMILGLSQIPRIQLLEAYKDVCKDIVRGIIHRHVAASGDPPSDAEFRTYESIALRAAGGESKAWDELSEISAGLLEKWISRNNNSLAPETEKQKAMIEGWKRKISRARYWSVTLQILGLIFVLAKDISKL